MKCKPLYMPALLLFIGIYLSFILLDCKYVSYAEASCLENIEDEQNEICGKNINYMTYTDTFTIFVTSDALAEPFQLISTFLDEYGNEILKAVITLFVVIDPIGIIPLFASFMLQAIYLTKITGHKSSPQILQYSCGNCFLQLLQVTVNFI